MTNKEKFSQEVREFYKTKESEKCDSWKVIDIIGAKYGLDEIDIDEELFIVDAENLILNGRCETLEEATQLLHDDSKRLTEAILNGTTLKPDKWLLLENNSDDEINLNELIKDLGAEIDVESLSNEDITKLLSEKDELDFKTYIRANGIHLYEVTHFKTYVCSPWEDYSSNATSSTATYKDKSITRTLLPPFASTLVKSFEGYKQYNIKFSQLKSLHSIDYYSRESDHFLSNIDKLVEDYTSIGYIASRNSDYVTKIAKHSFEYTYNRAKRILKNKVKLQTSKGCASLLCYIQYVCNGGRGEDIFQWSCCKWP